jgi:diadenosine tetraphosphate (Ap4A) HIT family hydrolase
VQSHSTPQTEHSRVLLAESAHWLLVRVTEADWDRYPAYYRLIAKQHVQELSELSVTQRQQMMAWMARIDALLVESFRPAKINWASFGNVVPHLHWHAIVRDRDDAHFPAPIWAAPARDGAAAAARWNERLPAADQALQALGGRGRRQGAARGAQTASG